MKYKMIASALLIMLLTATVSTNVNAAPWRGGYRPHAVVRFCPPVPVFAPPVVEVGGGYYGGGYARPYYQHEYAYRDRDDYRYRGGYRDRDGYRDHDGYRGHDGGRNHGNYRR